jgi:hypothetical protein
MGSSNPCRWRGDGLHHHGDGMVFGRWFFLLCVFWPVTCQSDMSYQRFRGVTKWPTQACTIPNGVSVWSSTCTIFLSAYLFCLSVSVPYVARWSTISTTLWCNFLK